jgi:hypothetical protein
MMVSYRHPRAHYPGGYWNRLLLGLPGQFDLCAVVQDSVEYKAAEA